MLIYPKPPCRVQSLKNINMPSELLHTHAETPHVAHARGNGFFDVYRQNVPEQRRDRRHHQDHCHRKGASNISQENCKGRNDIHHAGGEETSDAVCWLDIKDTDEADGAFEAHPASVENLISVLMYAKMIRIKKCVLDKRAVNDVLPGIVTTLQAEDIPGVIATGRHSVCRCCW